MGISINPMYIVTTVLELYADEGSMSLVRTFKDAREARSYYDAVKVQGISTILVYSDFDTEFLLCHYVAGENVGEVYNRYQRNKEVREYVRKHKDCINRAYGVSVRYSDTDSVKH